MDLVQQLQTLGDQLKKDFAAGQQEKLEAALTRIDGTIATAIEMSKEVKLTAVLRDPDLVHCATIDISKYSKELSCVAATGNLRGALEIGSYNFYIGGGRNAELPKMEAAPKKIIVLMYK